MTDEEVVKVLECCTTKGVNCKDCPAFVKVEYSNCKKYFKGAIDLINRQKAEIQKVAGAKRGENTSLKPMTVFPLKEKPLTVSRILEKVINDICDKYCKYPDQFMGDEEDKLYEICDNCPLNKFI